jgi:hypothetical protein
MDVLLRDLCGVCGYIAKGCVIPTSHYLTLILHLDTLSVEPMYMGPTYMGPTYMGLTPYVSWCRIDVG